MNAELAGIGDLLHLVGNEPLDPSQSAPQRAGAPARSALRRPHRLLYGPRLMPLAFEVCRLLSLVAFLLYGISSIWGSSMVLEFERFGLARFRVLTGAVEVLGALGLVASFWLPSLAVVAAGGLALLMLLGVITRLRVRDTLCQTLPAFVLLVMNAFVAVAAASTL